MGAVVRTHTHTHSHARSAASVLDVHHGAGNKATSLQPVQLTNALWMSPWSGRDLAAQAGGALHGYSIYEGGGGGGSPTWIYLSNELENGEAFPLNSPRGMVVRGVCWDTQQSLHHHPPPPPHHQPAPAGGFPSSMFNLDQPRLSSLPRIRRSVSW